MNKKFAIVLALLLISIVCCACCIDPQDPVDPVTPVDPVDPVDPIVPVEPEVPEVPAEEYSVMFMLNYDGAGAYTAETVKAGDTVSMPASPSRSGYTFNGWFTEAEGGAVYDFTQAVNEDTMLYAQWSKKKSSSSGSSHTHHYEPTVVDPTCVDRGYTTYAPCSCGATKADDTFTEPTGEHSYETGEKDGQTGVLCSGCNDFQSSGILIGDTLYDTFAEAMDAAEYTTNEVDMITLIGGVESVDVTQDVIIDLNGQEATLNYGESTPIKILKEGYSKDDVTVNIKPQTVTRAAVPTKTVFFEDDVNSEDAIFLSNEDSDLLTVAYAINDDGEVKLYDAYTAYGLENFANIINGQGDSDVSWDVTLKDDIDLYNEDENGNPVSFTPIGGVDKGAAFVGTFDGQDHVISNLYQSGWDLGYEYGQQAGIGLFGWIGDATIKNLKLDDAEISMEAVVMGAVAGYAAGDCTFENISVSNSQIANYNWDTGGIVGQLYGTEEGAVFRNINIDASNNISGHWGTWDVSAGGVIGRTADNTKVLLENVNVACVLDVYNDVVAAYQWYAYRYSGMLVGYTKTTETIDGRTVATAPHVTCNNVVVTYGNWANYTYCQFTNIYPQFVREQGGYSTDPYYSGRHWTAAVDINGDKVVDANHVHNTEGDNIEKHSVLLTFDQLFGGGQGVYGTASHPGVTVIYNNRP